MSRSGFAYRGMSQKCLTLFLVVLSCSRWISDPSFVSGNSKPEPGPSVFGFFYFTMTPAPNFAGLRLSSLQQIYQQLRRIHHAGAFRNLTRPPSAWLPTDSWKPSLSEKSSWLISSSASPQSMRHNPRRSPSSCATHLFPASCARYTSWPQGLHAPVPNKHRRASQAGAWPVRRTDGRTSTLAGAELAGRGSPGAAIPAPPRPRRARHRRSRSCQVHGGLLQAPQHHPDPGIYEGTRR